MRTSTRTRNADVNNQTQQSTRICSTIAHLIATPAAHATIISAAKENRKTTQNNKETNQVYHIPRQVLARFRVCTQFARPVGGQPNTITTTPPTTLATNSPNHTQRDIPCVYRTRHSGTTKTPHVRVIRARDTTPVHGPQRRALGSAVACAKILESVPATRVHIGRELVHAVAGLQVRWRSNQHTRAPNTACKRQWIRLPASAPPHPATAHGRQQQATMAAKGGLPQPLHAPCSRLHLSPRR